MLIVSKTMVSAMNKKEKTVAVPGGLPSKKHCVKDGSGVQQVGRAESSGRSTVKGRPACGLGGTGQGRAQKEKF